MSEFEVKKIPLTAIRQDGDTQSRHETRPDVVQTYCEAMCSGIEFPALDVFWDGGQYWLADGFHRYEAACLAYGFAAVDKPGVKLNPKFLGKNLDQVGSVLCRVFPGDKRAAVLHSVTSNHTHGLQRSPLDKTKAVKILLEDSEWGSCSDRWIAITAGVSHPFVAKIRAETESTGNVSSAPLRKAADGRVIDTGNIGKTPRPVKPKPKTEFECKTCGEVFEKECWHCATCDEHWPMTAVHCEKCYRAPLFPLPPEPTAATVADDVFGVGSEPPPEEPALETFPVETEEPMYWKCSCDASVEGNTWNKGFHFCHRCGDFKPGISPDWEYKRAVENFVRIDKQRAELQAKNFDLAKDLEKTKKELAALKKELKTGIDHQEVEDLRRDKNYWCKEAEKFGENWLKASDELTEAKETILAITAERDNLRKELETVSSELLSVRRENRDLTWERDQFSQERAALQAQKQQLEVTISALKRDLVQAEEESTQLAAKPPYASKEFNDLLMKKYELEGNLEETRREIRFLKHSNTELAQAKKVLVNENIDLKKKVSSLEGQFSNLNSGTVDATRTRARSLSGSYIHDHVEPESREGSAEGNQPKAKSKKKAALTDMPKDFPPDSVKKWAFETYGLTPETFDPEFQKFKDHHTAKGSRFADWNAALRLWISRAIEYCAKGGTAYAASQPNTSKNSVTNPEPIPDWYPTPIS